MSKILIVFIALITLFFGIRYLIEGFSNNTLYISEFNETTKPQQVLPERVVSSSGPNTPNAALRESMATVIAESEKPSDPYEQSEGVFPVEDSMRYPERSFGPAAINDQTEVLANSGVASNSVQQVNNSFRVFSPEFAETGGYIDEQVTANDTLDAHIYSAF
jgi:hypothetical protein